MQLLNSMNKTLPESFCYSGVTVSRSTLELLALVSILVFGATLRFWNITLGLPDLYVHDEVFEIHRALELLRGEYNFYRTKGMYFYLLSIMSYFYGMVLIFLGYFSDLKSFIVHSIVHPGDIILLSRLLCATLGTLSIYLIYRLGSQIFLKDSPGFFLLPIAWATCGLAAWVSKWGLIETTLTVFGILAFFPILKLWEDRSPSVYILAGFLIACATATKVYGVLLFLPLIFAHVLGNERATVRTACRAIFQGKFIIASLIFVVSLLILNPAIPASLMKAGDLNTVIPQLSIDGNEIYPFPFYFKHLRWNLGMLGVSFFAIGVVVAAIRFDKKVLTCAMFALCFFLILGFRKESVLIYARYLLISLPFFFIVAVFGFDIVWRWGQAFFHREGMKRLVRQTAVVVMVVGFSWNGLDTLLANPVMGKSFVPVYQEALKWFEAHVPEGTTVVVRGETRPWPGNQSLPLFDLEENYRNQYEVKKQEGKTFSEIGFLLELASAHDVVRYNLINENRKTIWKEPKEYVKDGAEYFVVDVEYFSGQVGSKRSLMSIQSRQKFYELLQQSSSVTLAKTFQGLAVTGAERTIEVYKVKEPHV